MDWNAEKIDKLIKLIDDGLSIKALIRQISIDSILDSESNTEPVFPFSLHKSGKIFKNFRAANVPYKMNIDEQNCYNYYRDNPDKFIDFMYKSVGDKINSKKSVQPSCVNTEVLPTLLEALSQLQSNLLNKYKNRDSENYILSELFGKDTLSQFLNSRRLSDNELHVILVGILIHSVIFRKEKIVVLEKERKNYFSVTYLAELFLKYYQSLPYYLKPGFSINIRDGIQLFFPFDNESCIAFKLDVDDTHLLYQDWTMMVQKNFNEKPELSFIYR